MSFKTCCGIQFRGNNKNNKFENLSNRYVIEKTYEFRIIINKGKHDHLFYTKSKNCIVRRYNSKL